MMAILVVIMRTAREVCRRALFFHWFLWDGRHLMMLNFIGCFFGVALPLWVFADF